MIHKQFFIITLIGILVFLVGCSAEAATVAAPEPADAAVEASGTIVLGDVSDNPTKKINRFQPLADYLAANLGEYGIGVGEVRIAPDIVTMAKWLEAGDVDLYFDSPFPAMMISNQSGAKPVLRRWKDGVAEYNTVIFARADSGLTSINDLNGHMMAMEDPYSTSAFMLPAAYLKEAGLNLVKKDAPNSVVSQDEIGYVFSGEDVNTVQWAVSGKVSAGVTDSSVFAGIPEETRSELVVLAETESVPRQVVMVRPGMDAAQLEAVKALLIQLDQTEEGQAVLEKFVTSKFDEFPQGADAGLARMEELYQLVQER